MLTLFISLIGSLVFGALLGYAAKKYIDFSIIKKAQQDADDLLAELKEQVQADAEIRQQKIQDIEIHLWNRVEKELLDTEERLENLQDTLEDKKAQQTASIEDRKKILSEDTEELNQFASLIQTLEGKLHSARQRVNDLQNNYINKLVDKTGSVKTEATAKLAEDMVSDEERRSKKWVEESEEETKFFAELKAKKILDIAIDRFARPYCPERGIGAVHFPDVGVRKNFLDPQGLNIAAIQSVTGCDIIVHDDMEMIGVAGFDPVRRELTRRVLERLMKEKKAIKPDFVKKIAENHKRELFNQIKKDGDAIAKELRMESMHPEVRQMMGSLRYRYSFTQNQYFHCGEVGWLGGLLASEMGLDIKKARRSGLLHDIGKSMDHAIEGGHAVIGADFIAARGEQADIVHNVRAHHHDETPSTPHAYLVIAADAISGARPGARRSTIESYNQKVTDLQDIARSFDGVTDCIVLSGGRECRVTVNSRQVDDRKSLTLSQQIAARIEAELSYPGQIKVVVVRETVVTETTKMM